MAKSTIKPLTFRKKLAASGFHCEKAKSLCNSNSPKSFTGILKSRNWETGNELPKREMKSAKSFSIVLVTTPNLKTARGLAKTALSKRLIACANLIPKLESYYWWQGKI